MALFDAMTAACHSLGATPPGSLPPAGKWCELDIDGDPHGKGDARLKLFPDGEGGIVHNWKTGEQRTFFANGMEILPPEQRAARQQAIVASRQRAEAELQQEREKTAAEAECIFNACTTAPAEHSYLTAKGIPPDCLRLYRGDLVIRGMRCDGALVAALRDTGGKLWSLSFIAANGEKRYLPGAKQPGIYAAFGRKPATAMYVAEGVATAKSISMAMDAPCAAAMDAGSLPAVAKALRQKFADIALVICADNDAGGTGLAKATEAALPVNALVVMPETDGQDFNDLHQHQGVSAVKNALHRAHSTGGENSPVGEYARNVDLIRASDVTPEPIAWLWNGWLAAGKMHVFGGAPGTGKTTISMGLAATVTTGGCWPDGSRSVVGNVVIWSGEDDPADTLIPRLALSGADLTRVYFIADIREGNERRSFDPARDMEPLRRKLAEIGGVRLLIVDPVVSAIAGDSHKNAEVRRGLQPLVDLAGAMRCALLGITHFSKGTGGRDPVERLTGSLAFGALARVVLVAAKHQEEGDDGRTVRLFCRAKSNIGPDDGGFEYDLHQAELKTHPGIFASSVLWGDAVEGAARELLATADATGDDGEGGTLADAKRFLSDLLANGPMRAGEIFKDADQAGYSKRSIQRAANTIKIERHKDGMRGGWSWRLPPKMPNIPEGAVDASLKSLAPLAPSAASSLVEVEI
jgi:putative DNA primase/helicase